MNGRKRLTYIPKTHRFIADHVSHDGDDCLCWPHGRDSLGYGRAKVAGFTTRLAHRIMCEMAHGEPPFEGAVARHLCGKGHEGCVNPKHLAWGTHAENVQDAISAGRVARGEGSGRSVLTDAIVLKIRSMIDAGNSQRHIAKFFGVSAGTVQAVAEGRTWGHIQ